MTNPVEEHAYRSQRRYIFVVTVILALATAMAGGLMLANSRSSSSRSSSAPTPTGSMITLPSQGVDTVAYSFDGNYLAAGNANGIVRVWRTSTCQVTKPQSTGQIVMLSGVLT